VIGKNRFRQFAADHAQVLPKSSAHAESRITHAAKYSKVKTSPRPCRALSPL
jgi:hypothetical protein